MTSSSTAKNEGGEGTTRAAPEKFFTALGRAEIDRLGAACIGLNVERDLLTLAQRAHACCFNSGSVDEHVLAAAFRRNEAVALRRVEKLHCSNCHVCS